MTEEINELARKVEADTRYRVLRRIEPPRAMESRGLPPSVRRVAILDIETTGLDTEHDEIIELAVMTVDVDWELGSKLISNTLPVSWLQDPMRPVDKRITMITGLTNADVVGQSIDRAAFTNLMNSADLVIAHNARFDRAFIERRFPKIAGKPWACSLNEIDWLARGFDGRSLSQLLMQLGLFNDAHRAPDDVWSLFHLLSAETYDDEEQGLRSFLDILIEAAETESYVVEAVGAPFSLKSRLKARGYRWNPKRRVWWIELPYERYREERSWLSDNRVPNASATAIDARQRHL